MSNTTKTRIRLRVARLRRAARSQRGTAMIIGPILSARQLVTAAVGFDTS